MNMFDSLEPSGSRTTTGNGTSGLLSMLNTSLSSSEQRQLLRQVMKAKRLALSDAQQQFAANAILPHILTLVEQYQAQHIAFYQAFQGEISPQPAIDRLLKQGKKIYLPVLHPFSAHQLLFIAYQSPQDLSPNRFGILEPRLDVRKVLPLEQLDMLFVPLVACDKQGNRLGMGGGFYDRTLAQIPDVVSVGLAHRCQQVEQLPLESWDMPLQHLIIGECE